MILALIFACLLLIMLFVAAYVVLRPNPSPATDEGPFCGQCGYPVTGLPTSTCPECGCDRREVEPVNIRPGKFHPAVQAVLLAPLYLPVLLMVAVLSSTVAARVVLGHWPRPMLDDPGRIGIGPFFELTKLVLVLWLY